MPRNPADAALAVDARDLYADGMSTREVAAALGVDASTVARWVGAGLRKRGVQPTLDIDAIWRMRKQQKMPWQQIADALGASKTGVRNAYDAAYGRESGQVDHAAHLTGAQRTELLARWDEVPRHDNGYRATGTSDEGRRLVELLAHYRRAGVELGELGEVIGLTGSRIGALIRERYPG